MRNYRRIARAGCNGNHLSFLRPCTFLLSYAQIKYILGDELFARVERDRLQSVIRMILECQINQATAKIPNTYPTKQLRVGDRCFGYA